MQKITIITIGTKNCIDNKENKVLNHALKSHEVEELIRDKIPNGDNKIITWIRT